MLPSTPPLPASLSDLSLEYGLCPDLASLGRPHARLCLRIARFVSKNCQLQLRHKKLLLAVSGGADSLGLLVVFAALRRQLGHEICVVHIDHALRPESPAEADFVTRFCAGWQVECRVRQAPVNAYAAKHKVGLEEASRHLRYQLLEEERQNMHAAWIVTGHHRDDLAEDILMRLTRGTGWPALGGMVAVDSERHLLRPLLLSDPAALRSLLQSLELSWQEDASNSDMTWCRNRMRHIVMPLLRLENPSLHQGLENLWTLAREDAAHWENLLLQALHSHKVVLAPPCITLPKALLQSHDRATRLRLYLKAVRSLGQGQARASTLFQIDEAWSEGRGNTHFQLHGKISVQVLRGQVLFAIAAQLPAPSATETL